MPSAADIAARLPLTRPQDVILDDEKQSVWLAQAGMEIDLGAIAKDISPTGYAITGPAGDRTGAD